jgi:mannan polymerase II complex MNN10 subunit
MNGYASNDISWAAAKAKSDQFKGYPSFSTRNEGFFSRSKRKISSTLPRFNSFGATGKDWRESEKLGRGRWYPGAGGRWPKLKTFIGNVLRKFRFLLIVLAIIAFITFVASKARECSRSRQQTREMLTRHAEIRTKYRRNAHFGGGSKFVIILAANPGGGVMDWKGPREWAIERDSIKNKKKYAERWGYDLEIADMSTKKRYAHEWRESWEKVDIIRNCMRKFPDAEWYDHHPPGQGAPTSC